MKAMKGGAMKVAMKAPAMKVAKKAMKAQGSRRSILGKNFIVLAGMAVAMKAMKGGAMKVAKKAMKVKVMKTKAVSKVAKGKFARAAVLRGSKEKTVGGLTKASLAKNKQGKIVAKGASARSKKAWSSSPLKTWSEATKQARKALVITGVCAVGGTTAQGSALYPKVKSILDRK